MLGSDFYLLCMKNNKVIRLRSRTKCDFKENMAIPSALSARLRESTFCFLSFPSLRSLYVMVAVYSVTSSEGLMSTANLVRKDNVWSWMTPYCVLCDHCSTVDYLLSLSIQGEVRSSTHVFSVFAECFGAVIDSREKRSAVHFTLTVWDHLSKASTNN